MNHSKLKENKNKIKNNNFPIKSTVIQFWWTFSPIFKSTITFFFFAKKSTITLSALKNEIFRLKGKKSIF
jgi:hypothetical protein